MSHKKRKKLHKCHHHSKRNARGRCTSCGKWLCKECSKLEGGRFYCANGCDNKKIAANDFGDTAPHPIVSSKKQAIKNSSKKRIKKLSNNTNKKSRLSFWLPLMIFIILTLLFTIAIVVKRNISLSDENLVLKEKNEILMETIRKRNLYIKRLKDRENGKKDLPVEEESVRKFKGTSSSSIISKSSSRPFSYRKGLIPLNFINGSTDKKLIALTFDGGSHKNAVKEILDTLASRNVKATMFYTGEFIRKNKDLVKRITHMGHETGNHSFSHLHFTNWGNSKLHSTLDNINRDVIFRELERTDELFQKVVGKPMAPIWRAPYGEQNSQINKWAQEAGYIHIGWKQARSWWLNYDTNDWVPDRETPGYYTGAQVLEKVEKLSEKEPYGMNGAIMLWHLGTIRKNRNEQAHLYLGKIIDVLLERGYRFVTVTEMLEESGVDISMLRRRD